MERKAWESWIDARRRKSALGAPLTAAQIIDMARNNADDYVSIAEQRPSYMGTVESLVAEMRSAVTEGASEAEDENALADMSTMDRANLEMQLRQIADDAERRIRSVTQSMLDRIGAPKGDRRRTFAKAETPAPGAHRHYK